MFTDTFGMLETNAVHRLENGRRLIGRLLTEARLARSARSTRRDCC